VFFDPGLTFTHDSGRFVFSGLNAAYKHYKVVASADGYADGSAYPVAAEPYTNLEGAEEAVIQLKPARTLTVVVREAGGAPIAGAQVSVDRERSSNARMNWFWRTTRPERLERAMTNSDGIAVLQPPYASGLAYVLAEGYGRSYRHWAGEEELTFALPRAGSISGTVANVPPETESIRVDLMGPLGESPPWDSDQRNVRAESSFTFRFDGLAPGKYGLGVLRERDSRNQIEVNLAPGENVEVELDWHAADPKFVPEGVRNRVHR
jgi:hypothetical protein